MRVHLVVEVEVAHDVAEPLCAAEDMVNHVEIILTRRADVAIAHVTKLKAFRPKKGETNR